MLKYCDGDNDCLLHNACDRVPVAELRELPEDRRKSLSLIRVNVKFSTGVDSYGKKRVNASFSYGLHEYSLVVTDYEYRRQFKPYSTAEADCLLTISLGVPYEMDNRCYKLVAGVIEL
jgi:hypothetical protein